MVPPSWVEWLSEPVFSARDGDSIMAGSMVQWALPPQMVTTGTMGSALPDVFPVSCVHHLHCFQSPKLKIALPSVSMHAAAAPTGRSA